MGRERRRHPRLKVDPTCTIACIGEDNKSRNLAHRLVDISAKGACIASATRLRTGDPIRVEVGMPHLPSPFSCRAFVRWSQAVETQEEGRESFLAGLEFDALLPLPADRAAGDPNILEILHILRVAVAQLRLYPKDSPQVLKVGTECYHSVHSYLEQAGTLTLSRTPRGLLVNGKPITATGLVADSLVAAMLGLLAEVGIKSLTIKKGVTLEELITFLHALTRKFWDVKEGKEINKRLREERVFQITVDEVQYVALGEGDIVIEDAARKLKGGKSEVGKLLESLDHLIDSAAGEGLESEGRLHVMKRLLDQDPSLLKRIDKDAPPPTPGSVSSAAPLPAAGPEEGRIPFDLARDAMGHVARLMQEATPVLRGVARNIGLVLAGAFGHDPKLQAVLTALLSEQAAAGITEWTHEAAQKAPVESASVTRGREILSLPDEQKVQTLAQEGGKLLEELGALEQKELFRALFGSVMSSLGDRVARQRQTGGKALLNLRRVLEKHAPEEMIGEVETQGRSYLEQEKDATVYPSLAEMASFLADLRLRRNVPQAAFETLELLNRHYHIKDAAYARRSEQAYLALERVASGPGFAALTEKIRAGDAESIRILESLDAAATRFLIGEIKQADTNARRLHFAQFIARAGTGAATVLVDEIQKTVSPSDVMRLIEVLPHAMPVDMAELALGALVRHPAVAVRRRAAVMMADLAYPRAGGMLLEAFHEEKDLATQLVCVECMGKLRYKPALEPLSEAVENRNYPDDLRSAMCLTLGRIGDVRAVPVLVKLCSRGGWGGLTKIIRQIPPQVRAAAVRALALYPTHPDAREALREAQEDKDAGVRFAAGQVRLAPLFDAFGDPAQGAQMAASASDLRKFAVKLAGNLAEVPLDPLFRAIGTAEATGLLQLNFKGPGAKIWCDAGLIIAIDSEGRRDKEAFASFAARKEGYFLFLPGEAPFERRILVPPDTLLAETSKSRPDPRPGT